MSSPDQDVLGDETYHLRNPLKPVQPLRKHPRVERSDAEKRAINERRKNRKIRASALEADLESFHAECNAKIQDLCAKYEKKDHTIRHAIYHTSSLKKERKLNFFNAEVSYKIKELQNDDGDGRHILERAQKMVLEERAAREEKDQPLTNEERAAILQYAHEQRALKSTGARPTNRSAAKDVNFTSSKLQSEIKKMNARTGAAGVMFITRGHLQDVFAPTVYETENASGFCKQSLGHNLTDVGGRLECWASTGRQGHQSAKSTRELRKECVNLIIERLREITGRDDIAMNYQNYETSIVARYKVQLIGWPARVPFTNPSNISIDHLQRLRDALLSHKCTWQVMTREQIDLHNAKLDADARSGGNVRVPRKERSDKNKKRRSNRIEADENDDETATREEHTSRKKKRRIAANDKGKGKRTTQPRKKGGSKAARQMPPLPISTEEIPSDADSDSE